MARRDSWLGHALVDQGSRQSLQKAALVLSSSSFLFDKTHRTHGPGNSSKIRAGVGIPSASAGVIDSRRKLACQRPFSMLTAHRFLLPLFV